MTWILCISYVYQAYTVMWMTFGETSSGNWHFYCFYSLLIVAFDKNYHCQLAFQIPFYECKRLLFIQIIRFDVLSSAGYTSTGQFTGDRKKTNRIIISRHQQECSAFCRFAFSLPLNRMTFHLWTLACLVWIFVGEFVRAAL